MLNIKKFIAGPIETNTYIVYDDKKKGFIIDPGFPCQELLDFIKKEKLKIEFILITHGHFDHVCFVSDLQEKTGAQIAMSENDIKMMEQSHAWSGKQMGYEYKYFAPDLLLEDGDIIKAGKIQMRVIATPGHSRGGLCFYMEDEKILFSGDTIFAGAVGRTDLPFSSEEEIWKSIKEKLFVLPDEVKVFPGHGKETTIRQERR
ncbi:MAG: MBL fold metallo-hydrolase [Patescibacteria group bacterium]